MLKLGLTPMFFTTIPDTFGSYSFGPMMPHLSYIFYIHRPVTQFSTHLLSVQVREQEAELLALKIERQKRKKLERQLHDESLRRDELVRKEIRLREQQRLQVCEVGGGRGSEGKTVMEVTRGGSQVFSHKSHYDISSS